MLILSELIDKHTLIRAEIPTVLVALSMGTLKFLRKGNQREQPGKGRKTSHTRKLPPFERCAFDHKFWIRPTKWARNPRGRPTFGSEFSI